MITLEGGGFPASVDFDAATVNKNYAGASGPPVVPGDHLGLPGERCAIDWERWLKVVISTGFPPLFPERCAIDRER
jgi:hypothetical protein